MLTRLNTAIDTLYSALLLHSAELHACTGPVPRHVVDELLEAVEQLIREHDADLLGPMLDVMEMTQRAVDSAAAEVLALADGWDDEDEPTAFREWQQDVTA